LAIDGRLYSLLIAREHSFSPEMLIEQCAIRQCDFAARCVQGLRAGHDAIVSVGDVIPLGITAILQHNWDALAIVASRPSDERTAEWVEGLYECFVGVAQRQPDLIAKSLSRFLLGIQNLRQKDGLTDAVNLTAQGLYWLCEWVDPQLVSQFDVDQPRPWDAQFHRWCEDRPDPLADVDLTSISPALHETIVLDQWPAWLPSEPAERWEIVLTGMGKLVNFGRGMGPYRKVLLGMLENGPVVTHWNLTRQNAEHRCHQMAEVGGQTEIRPSAGTNYRLFSLKQSKVTEWGREASSPG
jgi:hypothetical protein